MHLRNRKCIHGALIKALEYTTENYHNNKKMQKSLQKNKILMKNPALMSRSAPTSADNVDMSMCGARVMYECLVVLESILKCVFNLFSNVLLNCTRNARGTLVSSESQGQSSFLLSQSFVGVSWTKDQGSRVCTVGTRFPVASNASIDAGSIGLDSNSLVNYARTAAGQPSRRPTSSGNGKPENLQR